MYLHKQVLMLNTGSDTGNCLFKIYYEQRTEYERRTKTNIELDERKMRAPKQLFLFLFSGLTREPRVKDEPFFYLDNKNYMGRFKFLPSEYRQH